MKRSEMTEQLSILIWENVWNNNPNEFADRIISFLESKGMQPPPRIVHDFLVPAQDGREALRLYAATIYQWEPEDETN